MHVCFGHSQDEDLGDKGPAMAGSPLSAHCNEGMQQSPHRSSSSSFCYLWQIHLAVFMQKQRLARDSSTLAGFLQTVKGIYPTFKRTLFHHSRLQVCFEGCGQERLS
jgi:hypothetical protein